jgi:hypothetical protein
MSAWLKSWPFNIFSKLFLKSIIYNDKNQNFK